MKRWAIRLALVATVGCAATTAWAQPSGEYHLVGVNFPTDYDTFVSFDGVEELVGGPEPFRMRVNERATQRAGTPGGIATNRDPQLSWEQSGLVVEYIFDTEDGGQYNNFIFDPWTIGGDNLNFGDAPWRMVENTFYGYWRTPDGNVTIPQNVIDDFELTVGPHPTDASVGQVAYFGNDPVEFPDGKITFGIEASSGLSSGALEFLFGVSPLSGVTIAAMYQPVLADVPGDTDHDSDVDLEDLNNVRNNFGSSGDPILGDTAPFDGTVDLGDLNSVRNNFGAGPGAATVPEPSAIALAVIAMLAVCTRRARRPS